MTIFIKPATESEKMVLGALLIDGPLVHDVINMLSPADFFHERHQQIYAAILDLFRTRGCFDVAMLVDEFSFPSHVLLNLIDECSSTQNIVAHAKILREKSVQRALLECAKKIDAQNKC